jgi:hypothetical protein
MSPKLMNNEVNDYVAPSANTGHIGTYGRAMLG